MTETSNNSDRWGLLVGVNKYSKLAPRYQLQGCVNDVELMAGILKDNFGFEEEKITVLRDEEATRDGILQAMDALVEDVGEDDVAVVHFSGHGSRMRDPDGDEPDGYDETIVPHDSGRSSHPNRDIRDDEIYEWLLRLTSKTPYVTLIFDCCHSGSITRDAFGEQARWVEPDDRPVEELGIDPISIDIARGAGRDLGPSGWLPLGDRYVLIAGCRDEESSYEHTIQQGLQKVRHGALTFFLSQELNKVTSGTTYRDLFDRVSPQVTAKHSRQHPQIEGARDRELFGVRDITPMRFVPVTQREGETVTLAAGAAHGITDRSQYAIYSQETKTVTDDTTRLGLVEIAAVGALTSEAKVLEEEEEGIVEGARAVEHAHFYGEMTLVVDVHAPASYQASVDGLTELIDESMLVSMAEEGELADIRLSLVAPRDEVSEGDPVPQLGDVADAIWAMVEDGEMIDPPRRVDDPEVANLLLDSLENKARYRNAIALANPNPGNTLKDGVQFNLKRQKPDGTWETIPEEGLAEFEVDEKIAFEVVNKLNVPVYVSVLDFGVTDGITLLYPLNRSSENFEPNVGPVSYGEKQGEEIELWIPETFQGKKGTDTFKLFATTQESDFSWLSQEATRSLEETRGTKGFGTPIQQLFDLAYTGEGTRDAKPVKVPKEEEWFTIERTFTLRKKL
jgi:hypothetical protein